jgi:hypothetical protein
VDPKKEMAQNHKYISGSIKMIGNQTISRKKNQSGPKSKLKTMKKTLKDCRSHNIRGSKPKEDFSNTSRSLKKTYGFIEERKN